jgi:hypothetical protein
LELEEEEDEREAAVHLQRGDHILDEGPVLCPGRPVPWGRCRLRGTLHTSGTHELLHTAAHHCTARHTDRGGRDGAAGEGHCRAAAHGSGG